MKHLLIPAIVIFGSLAENTFAHNLTVNVDNIKKIKGALMIAIYDSANNFSTDQNKVQGKTIVVTDKHMQINFSDLPSGNYAVKLFHDENENKKLDTNLLGIPKETYGFSNNTGSIGQPSFDEAKFKVSEDVVITIHLH